MAYIVAFLIVLCSSIASKGTLVFMLKQVAVILINIVAIVIVFVIVFIISVIMINDHSDLPRSNQSTVLQPKDRKYSVGLRHHWQKF